MAHQKIWEKHYPEEIPLTLSYTDRLLHEVLMEQAEKNGDHIAIRFLGKTITYRKLWLEVRKTANFLQSQHIKKGQRVAIMLPNCPQAVISYYAILAIGAIVVEVNPLYKEREIKNQLIDAEVSAIITLDLLAKRIEKIEQQVGLEQVIITSISDYLPFPKNILYSLQKQTKQAYPLPVLRANTFLWHKIMKQGNDRDIPKMEIDQKNDIALLQYTGGTTGEPKGVMLSHYNLIVNAEMAKAWIPWDQNIQANVLGVLPFFHVYGMTAIMNYSIFTGSKMILVPKFDALSLLKTIKKEKPNIFPGAPTIYIGLLKQKDIRHYDLSSIDYCISGSASLPMEVKEAFEKVTKGRLVEGYGLTEASPITHANFMEKSKHYGGIGVPWPDTDAKIVTLSEKKEADIGEIGELIVRGPQIMMGYWRRVEETEEIKEDGWLFTGDLAYMDHNGFFYIVDRKKDVIIASGYNIYPREVEEVLYEIEGVEEAVVVGIPDVYRGETAKAFIVMKEGYTITEEEIKTHCREVLANFKVPTEIEFRDSFPKTAVGKILRRRLME